MSFEISTSWLPPASDLQMSETAATMCRLAIELDRKVLTEFRDDAGAKSKHLEIPAYYVAEWIAENWWPLLWEPRLAGVQLRHNVAARRNRSNAVRVGDGNLEALMAKKAKKQTARGRKQDRARVAGGQDYEVGYESRKTGRSSAAVKKVGNSRKRVERRLAR